jgi:hypothetical protein
MNSTWTYIAIKKINEKEVASDVLSQNLNIMELLNQFKKEEERDQNAYILWIKITAYRSCFWAPMNTWLLYSIQFHVSSFQPTHSPYNNLELFGTKSMFLNPLSKSHSSQNVIQYWRN